MFLEILNTNIVISVRISLRPISRVKKTNTEYILLLYNL